MNLLLAFQILVRLSMACEPGAGAKPGESPNVGDHAGLSMAEILTSPEFEWGPPVSLGPAINSAERHRLPTLSADELVIAYKIDTVLWIAERTDRRQPFEHASPLPILRMKSVNEMSSPSLSGDGLQLLLASGHPGEYWEDIWVLTRTARSEPFGDQRMIPDPVSTKYRDGTPRLTSDALTLLIGGWRPGAPAGSSIYQFDRPALDQPFGAPVRLGDNVNAGEWTIPAWLSQDRTALVSIHLDKPSRSLLHVRANSNGEFGPGQPILVQGEVVEYPWISPDGQRMYFGLRKPPESPQRVELYMSERIRKAASSAAAVAP